MTTLSDYFRRYYEKNKEKERERAATKYQRYVANDPIRVLLNTVRSRAKRKGLSFNLVKEDIEIPALCPVFLEPLIRGTRYAPSIDRIDPSLGYEPDNIQIISYQANVMKFNATREELRKFADWIYSNE